LLYIHLCSRCKKWSIWWSREETEGCRYTVKKFQCLPEVEHLRRTCSRYICWL